MRACERCGKMFIPVVPEAIVCSGCCHLPDEKICFDHLHLGEGSVECFLAHKGHPQPHYWEGEFDGATVRIEWSRDSNGETK